MNNPLLLLALAAALPGMTQAQSIFTINSAPDAGLAIGKRDTNTRAFKGVDELGSGLKALIALESRYEPNTRAWLAMANYAVGAPGIALGGYGRKVPEGMASIRQWSIAHAFPLLKRGHAMAHAPERAAF